MKVAILHQYSLYGSGSSVYVRDIACNLSRLGHEVHLVSLEPCPGSYDFFEAAYLHSKDSTQCLFQYVENPRCISHTLSVNPVPVAYARIDVPNSKLFVTFTDEEIDNYVHFFFARVKELAQNYAFDVIHANHMVLTPYIAALVRDELQIPYVVTIHGSVIEYVVLKDARYLAFAIKGLEAAGSVIVLNSDVRKRVLAICPQVEDLLVQIPVGVDGVGFRPVLENAKSSAIDTLLNVRMKRGTSGKTDELIVETRQAAKLRDGKVLINAVEDIQGRYNASHPDTGLAARLKRVDWYGESILVYFGKLLFDKGIHCLLAAMPEIVASCPNACLIVIGSGVDREFLEMGIAALDLGDVDLFRNIIRTGMSSRNADAVFMEYIDKYLGDIDTDIYISRCCGKMQKRVVFTGYLTRADLAQILPHVCLSIVPSIVKEAFPMVSIESIACGVPTVASYFSGLRPILDEVAAIIEGMGEFVKIGHAPERMVRDLGKNIPALLGVLREQNQRVRISEDCRHLVEQKYMWKVVIRKIEKLYQQMTVGDKRATDRKPAGEGVF